ncbi:MAG: beta-glucuronidase [Bacteroidetes bacterium GWA2_40_14]|nr:MAG: beta-glucuronidase [Bacteroidetes bacterium GWA2_40_14]HAZ02686.1 beta-glucuronidase [Marinilabiliales bacterium]
MRFSIPAFLLFVLSQLSAQSNQLTNEYIRPSQSLNGTWNYIVDPYETGYYNYRYQPYDEVGKKADAAFFNNAKPSGKSDLIEYNFDESDTIQVPGDWNTQKEKLFYYEGTIWYKKSFDYQRKSATNRVFLHFGAVNYQADVYLNGTKLGKHLGGFTPFSFEVSEVLKKTGNYLVVKVDNKRHKEGVPTLNTDWWNYGGITRDVKLVEVPADFISEHVLQMDTEKSGFLSGYIQLNGSQNANQEVKVNIPELKIQTKWVTDAQGRTNISVPIKKINFWSPENPYLYPVLITTNQDTLRDTIGFRTIKTQGTKLLLNNKEVFLRGICIHEENALRGGRAYSDDDAKMLLGWAKELGCNYVRLAHYPHNEHMVRLADEMGIMVWEEIPVYWTIQWENAETYQNAVTQLKDVIRRDKNRASVIIWSMANETPNSSPRFEFLSNLAKTAKNLDNTRLISAALEQGSVEGNPSVRTISDPFADVVDVLSFNQYIGWYDGLPDKCSQITWEITQNKPVLISEFGADARFGFHADSLTRFSEEYQAYVYTETLKMFSKIPQLSGFSPWILVDFRSPRRVLPNIQDGWNRKGLISSGGERKQAFYILQEYYRQKTIVK